MPMGGGGGGGAGGPATQIVETSGPDTLDFGAINDGEYFKRDGTDVVGDTPTGASGPFAMSLRVLDGDVEIPDNYGAIVVGPLDMNGHDITFGTNSALAVL